MRYLTRSAVALAALLLFWLVAPGPTVAGTTALQVTPAGGPPQSVRGSDGREHIAYNLVITNAFTADATLKSMVVRGGGERLLTLRGEDLAFYTRPLGSEEPTTSVPKASAVVVYVDVALPRSAGRTVPRSLHHRISYKIPDDAPVHQIIGSTTIDRPDLQVDRRPIEIAPPLRGDGWMNAYGCCDPDLKLRSTMLAENGAYVSPETFAIDYIQLVDGRFYIGDGTRNSDWHGFGAGIHSVSQGKVVWAADRLPDVPPFTNLPDNPTVNDPVQFCGNGVVIKMRKRVFGHYCHMKPGSVRVDVGQRVRTGQKLGLLGNSGNTSGAHLHFGLTDSPQTLGSNSLPFEIDRFRLQGTAEPSDTPGQLTVTGEPHNVVRAHPLLKSVTAYGNGR